MSLTQRIEKLERELKRKQRYNRPYKYFEPDSGEQIKAWEKQITDLGFRLDDFIVIILPPRPEKVNWGALTTNLLVLADNYLSGKEIEKHITA